MTSPAPFELSGKRVFVAGHKGMVGSAIARRLASEACDILTADRAELDLIRQSDTERWLVSHRPDVVVIAAAVVGGIHANSMFPATFLADNLAIGANLIAASHKAGVQKLLALGSSCIYPRLAKQPMSEDALLTGPLEPTNEWYAIAKIATLRMCDAYREQYGADFISFMPTNIYGPGDNYHPEYSHVPAALISRFHAAKLSGADSVTVWGSGSPRREFLYADDLADACVFALKRWSGAGPLNVGSGHAVTIAEFAQLVREVVGYKGTIEFDTSRPDGTPEKLLDSSKLMRLGWKPSIGLREGLEKTYAAFLAGSKRVREIA
jgi:GDP-L-fucose synthase